MPPYTLSTETEKFLLAVIINNTNQAVVDWKAVAQQTGLSAGGARNKLTFIRQGNTVKMPAGNTTLIPADPKKQKQAVKRKTGFEESEDDDADDQGVGHVSNPKTPRAPKTPKTPKTPRRAAKKAKTKKQELEEDEEVTDSTEAEAEAASHD